MNPRQTGPRQTNLRQTQLLRLKRRQLLQPRRRRDWKAGGRASNPARKWRLTSGFPKSLDGLHGAVDTIAEARGRRDRQGVPA
jgi:hypothetical protein